MKDDKSHDPPPYTSDKSYDKVDKADKPAAGSKFGQQEATPKKATKAGFTMCKVTGTAIKYGGKLIAEGTVAEFDDATILEMPAVLVSVE